MRARNVWGAMVTALQDNAYELLLSVSLLLIASGFWYWWRPGSFLVPGVVLLWIAIPSRAGFIANSERDVKRDR